MVLLFPGVIYQPEYQATDLQSFQHRFIVQNLASLTLRVYQRNCDFTQSCANTLIYQAPMVIGADEEETRTQVGSYKIVDWIKFYQDIEGKYQPWSNHPAKPHQERRDWHSGAFGWYTARLEPGADGQWLHGTIGWGADGEKFIKHNQTSSGRWDRVRSHGCTRVSNQSIAFLRNFVPKGSWVFRIYALEDLGDPKLLRYQSTPPQQIWHYALSKGRKDLLKNPLENFLDPVWEQNSLVYSAFPRIIQVQPKGEEVKGYKNYNPYEVKRNDFKGLFLVDEGVVVNYQTPKKIITNGYRFPDFFNLPSLDSSNQLAQKNN